MSNKTLDKIVANTAKRERERIIGLLEELQTQMLALQQPGYKDLTGNMATRAKGVEIAIALIKGENK